MITMTLVGPDDSAQIEEIAALGNAVNAADSPWEHPIDPVTLAGRIRYGHDLEPAVFFLFHRDGEAVASGWVHTSQWDNLDFAWSQFAVHPAVRRHGVGSEVVGLLKEHVRSLGRSKFGTGGWEASHVEPFAVRHGFSRASTAVCRRHFLDELPDGLIDGLHDEAATRAGGYSLERITGPMPEELMASYVAALSALNDAPTDDLDIEDEVFDPERTRNYEKACALRGERLYRLLAIHDSTGEVAGITGVGVDGHHPDRAHQHDTEVVPAHRGHRLGMLLKTEMVRWLAQAEPQVATVDTWNAESNDFMISVNERLGYRVMSRAFQFQTVL